VYSTLFHIGHLSLPTFGALAAIGLMLAMVLSQRTALLAGVLPDRLWDAGLVAVLTAFVVSRLLLVVTHFDSFARFPVLLLAVPSLTPMGVVLTVAVTGMWLYIKRIPLLPALDGWAPCATLVWAFLAMGHYAEGSDPGMPRVPGGEATYPVALYAAGLALTITYSMVIFLRQRYSAGHTIALTLVLAGLSQFFLGFLREPGLTQLFGLDLLQLISLGMVVAGCLLWLTATRPRDSLR
jgi:phosphatidylglycerol:prolipoprotein diacylglycerol transferase